MKAVSGGRDERQWDPRTIGYMAVGFASLIGGIFIFIFIVIPQRQPESGVPRDVQMIFTQVFSNQSVFHNETGRYTPALIQLDVDQDTCRRFSCLLTLDPSGEEYRFKLSKSGRSWAIHSKSPVPEEIP